MIEPGEYAHAGNHTERARRRWPLLPSPWVPAVYFGNFRPGCQRRSVLCTQVHEALDGYAAVQEPECGWVQRLGVPLAVGAGQSTRPKLRGRVFG